LDGTSDASVALGDLAKALVKAFFDTFFDHTAHKLAAFPLLELYAFLLDLEAARDAQKDFLLNDAT
jgi:hypothetical protein